MTYYVSTSTTYDPSYDHGPFDTEQEAVSYAKTHKGIVGQAVSWSPSVSADTVIQQALEDAYEVAGDASDDWLMWVGEAEEKELSDMLTKTFREWLAKHGREPTFVVIEEL